MNEKSTGKPQEMKNGISPSLLDDFSQLAAETQRLGNMAQRKWKTRAVVFVILLAVIGGYLKLFVYDYVLGEYCKPEILVQSGLNIIDSSLVSAEMPTLASGKLPDWGAEQAIKMAPDLVNNRLKAEVERLLKELPKQREELVKDARTKIPEATKKLVEELDQEMLPQARKLVIEEISKQLDVVLDDLDTVLKDVVRQVVVAQKDNVQAIKDKQVLEEALAISFEDYLGGYMDDIFVSIEPHIAGAAANMEKLVRNPDKTDQEKLELRIIQLMLNVYENVGKGASEDLMQYEIPVGGNELLDEVGKEIDKVKTGGPA